MKQPRITKKTRLLSMFLGFIHIDICLILSVVTDISTDFLYKIAVLGAGLPAFYIIGRTTTYFSDIITPESKGSK